MLMQVVRLDVMRFTIVDGQGAVSFVAHTSAALALTAACAQNPTTLAELLEASRQYDRTLSAVVTSGLVIFDEHNLPDDMRHIHEQLRTLPPQKTPVFRVLDEATRDASLQTVRAGVILFNLSKKRIVQIANTYEALTRSGEVNYHNGRFLSRRVFNYELPPEWTIVP
jgi:flagellar biosynthesis/type III secretory pathway chaperone